MSEVYDQGKFKRAIRSLWKERLKWSLRLLWSLILFISIVIPLFQPEREKPPNGELGALKVYSQNRQRYGSWERKEVIKFSLDQVDSSINYLFLAAAAILGFVVKILVNPQLGTGVERKPHSPFVKSMLKHTAFGCIISISCGFFARSYFTMLADSADFSIYDEVGLAAFGQLTAFFIATLLMCWAGVSMVDTEEIVREGV